MMIEVAENTKKKFVSTVQMNRVNDVVIQLGLTGQQQDKDFGMWNKRIENALLHKINEEKVTQCLKAKVTATHGEDQMRQLQTLHDADMKSLELGHEVERVIHQAAAIVIGFDDDGVLGAADVGGVWEEKECSYQQHVEWMQEDREQLKPLVQPTTAGRFAKEWENEFYRDTKLRQSGSGASSNLIARNGWPKTLLDAGYDSGIAM